MGRWADGQMGRWAAGPGGGEVLVGASGQLITEHRAEHTDTANT
jgi:hypothetical protein